MHGNNQKYKHKKTSKPGKADVDVDVTVEVSGKPGRPKSPKKRP